MKATSRLVLIALAGILLAACATPNQSKDSSARFEDQLIQRNIAARGGLEKIRAVESTATEAEIFMPQMGFTMPVTIQNQRPGKMRIQVSLADMGMTFVTAVDGETAWSINPMVTSRPMRLPADEAQRLIEQADMDGILVDYASKGFSVSHAGTVEVGGRAAEKLRIVRPDSSEMAVYIDAETFRQVRMDSDGKNPVDGMPVKMETYLRDFRNVQGVQMPFEIEVMMNGEPFQITTVKDVKVNTVIADSLFVFPAE